MLALGGFGLAVAVEAGGYYVLTEQVAPTVSRLAVRAWQVGKPAVQAYARRAAKGALARMTIDAGFQFGTSYLAADSNSDNRALRATNSINGTSVLAAGAISVGEAKTLAKFLVAFSSAAATNLLTVSRDNFRNYQSYWHLTDFSDSHERLDYVRNVILGTLFDQSKEYGSEWVAKRLAGRAEEWAAQAPGRASKAVLKWITEARVALPVSFVIGGVPEIIKKRWENAKAAQEEAEKSRRQIESPRHTSQPSSANAKRQ